MVGRHQCGAGLFSFGGTMIASFRVYCDRAIHESIGDATIRVLNGMRETYPDAIVVAVIPAMISYFATSPERYQTVEADLIVEYETS
jgi:hypothetical protein